MNRKDINIPGQRIEARNQQAFLKTGAMSDLFIIPSPVTSTGINSGAQAEQENTVVWVIHVDTHKSLSGARGGHQENSTE